VSGICKANVLIWLKFDQALPQLTQYPVQCIYYVRQIQLTALSSPIKKMLMSPELKHQLTSTKIFFYTIYKNFISTIQKTPLFKWVFHSLNSLLQMRTQNRFLNMLCGQKYEENWYILQGVICKCRQSYNNCAAMEFTTSLSIPSAHKACLPTVCMFFSLPGQLDLALQERKCARLLKVLLRKPTLRLGSEYLYLQFI
jgi:hypothetical protein